MSGPFVFPNGSGAQALHGMGVQLRREARELPASVLASILPLIPRITTKTLRYDRVQTVLPGIWSSDALTVPVMADGGQDIVFVTMDGQVTNSSLINIFQILRNGLTVAQCQTQGMYGNMGVGDSARHFGIWAGPADPGDRFTLRAGQSSGDVGTTAITSDVQCSMTVIHYRQQAGPQDSKEADNG